MFQDVQRVVGKAVAIDAWDSGDQVVCGAVLLEVLHGIPPQCSLAEVIVGDIRFVGTTCPAALCVRRSLQFDSF